MFPAIKRAVMLTTALLLTVGVCLADMVIELHDGRRVTVPVNAGDVRSIHFEKARASAARSERRAEPPPNGQENVIRVGPGQMYAVPSEAAKVAQDGAVVEIDAAVYDGDVAVWDQNDLTLRGVGGRPHLRAAGKSAQGKAIWVIRGDKVTVENIEFSGTRVADLNGAGIRGEGTRLTVRNAHFHHNEMGLMTSGNPYGEVLIEGCEFNDNSVDYRRHRRLGHNIYIGDIAKFTLKNSYIHDAHVGHNVKSRAKENYILYNRISDEVNGSSYLLDLPNGGFASVIGNLFRQGRNNDNNSLIAFAAEKNKTNRGQKLLVVNNTLVNDARTGTFVNNHSIVRVRMANNLVVGPGDLFKGAGTSEGDLRPRDPGFRNRRGFDYRLTAESPAIDQAKAALGVPEPQWQYVHLAGKEPRPKHGKIDVGAYEYVE